MTEAVILQFPATRPINNGKGYKARFRAARERLGLAAPTSWVVTPSCSEKMFQAEVASVLHSESLVMDHVDPGMPSDSAYCAPASDLA